MSNVELAPAAAVVPVPVEAPQHPVEPVEVLSPDAYTCEPLEQIRKGDTLDVYARRLRSTSAGVTRATAVVGAPMTGLTLVNQSLEFGLQNTIGGTVGVAAGLVVAGAVYGTQRLKENGRARKSQAAQQEARNMLPQPEPIEFVRIKGKVRRGRRIAARWYGADEQYGGDDPSIVGRFAEVVDFAERQKLDSVVVSTRIFGHAKNPDLAEQYQDKATTTRQFFIQTKGVKINDRTADESLTRLTPAEARALLEYLEADTMTSKTDALAQWLVTLKPSHPLTRTYQEWRRLNRPDELLPNMARIMHGSVERHFQSDLGSARIALVPLEDDTSGAIVSHVKGRMDMQVSVSPHGIGTTSRSELNSDRTYSLSEHAAFSEFTGADMEDLVNDMLKRKRQGEDLTDAEIWKLEVALYQMLQRPDNSDIPDRSYVPRRGGTDKLQTETLYDRLPQERPRTFPRPWLPSRGNVSKADQSIEYGRMFWRATTKKIGAAAVAAAIGLGAGLAWGEAWSAARDWDYDCKPSLYNQRTLKLPPTPEQLAACDASYNPLLSMLGEGARSIDKGNADLEDTTLEWLYSKGIITPENAPQLAGFVTQRWLNEKRVDLERRYNLYDFRDSRIGDVEHQGSNPALWQLSPINGASTEGYWHQNTQENIRFNQVANEHTPPFKQGTISLERTSATQRLFPIGAPLPSGEANIEEVRHLTITDTPPDQSKPLIQVSGRQLLGTGAGVYLGPGPVGEANYWAAYSLPVLNGGDIVAAKGFVRDLATDKVLGTVEPRVYQMSDGTFHILVSKRFMQEGYLDLSYWVDPNSDPGGKGPMPLRAQRPMKTDRFAELPNPLTETLSASDVAELNKQLGLGPNATIQETAQAIARSRSYSFTPFKDNNADRADLDATVSESSTSMLLVEAATYAAEMKSANCNVATEIALVATRGMQADGTFVNGATGFHNNHDNVLSSVESHQWLVTNTGQVVDPTPSGGATPPPAEDYRNPAAQAAAETAIGPEIVPYAAALVLGAVLGKRFIPPLVGRLRRRRHETLLDWAAEGESNELDSTVNMLTHLIYQQDTPLHEDDLPSHVAQASGRRAIDRLYSLPPLSRSQLNRLIEQRTQDGTVRISKETRRRLIGTMARLNELRGYEVEAASS